MKYISTTIALLFGVLSFSQEKTYTQTELDALSNKSDAEPFNIIENVPLYKGCENEIDNAAKKQCMSQKIGQLFNDNFNTIIPKDSNLSPGLASVFIAFKVDEKGRVVDIEVKAETDYLINEAIRVTKLIPNLKPGYFRGEPVKVPFSLPLKIDLESGKKEIATYPVYRGCDIDQSNAELKKCSIKKIKNFIKLSFDYQMADRVMPLEQSTKFRVDFIINKKGKVEQVNAKANHRAIAIEAIRIAKRIPKFKVPGTKNGKPIETPFSLLMTVYFL
jgi:hypothetical protein